jgi:hypothetical protein
VESAEQHAQQQNHAQPILLIQGNFLSYHIAFEGICCSAGSSLVESLDLLFKFFWVFKIKYTSGLKMFFTFLQNLFGLKFGKEKIPSRVIEVTHILNHDN